jgi:catechol 2,3-dioxygenase-like lactoylglutathione lyase family enzyme
MIMRKITFTIAILVLTSFVHAAVREVGAVGITVSDMNRALDFYTNVLSFQKVSDVEVAGPEYEHLENVFGLRIRVARMKLGDEYIDLIDYLAPEGRPIPVDMKSNDHSFQHIAIIVSDMDQAYQQLRAHNVQHASTGPQRLPDWNKNAGGIQAFYFRDPDGHYLEILQFPEGKGNPKWHQKTDRLFLGIDHTAIVVSNTENSLKFYRDILGMKVAGESENYGTEQEHLNNVMGAHLRITALRASAGPGIEFLEYLEPRNGRNTPEDLQANDLANWQTQLISDRTVELSDQLKKNGRQLISNGIIETPRKELGYSKAMIVRDPDGHAMEIIEK